MSIGGVSGAANYSASAFLTTTATGTAAPAAAASSEDFLSSLAGGTGASASAGSQSSAQMLQAIQDPTRYESAGYYNQMAMLNAFGSSSSGSDEDSSPFDLLSQTSLTSMPQDVQAKYSQLAAQYGNGASSAGLNLLA